jgi:nucleotide-binding universal stress UspA family protein
VAADVLRESHVPVLIVPAACEHQWPVDRRLRVLIPLDGSDLAEEVLGPVGSLASALPIELVLLRAVPAPLSAAGPRVVALPASYTLAPLSDVERDVAHARHYLEDVAERLRTVAPTISVRVDVGPPVGTIAAVAHDEGVDLIAMATHGGSGLAGLLMGSTAVATLHRAATPMLLVRPAAMRQSSAVEPSADQSESVTLTFSRRDLAVIKEALEGRAGAPEDAAAEVLAQLDWFERQQTAAVFPDVGDEALGQATRDR